MKHRFIFLLIFFLGTTLVQAQVTIGSNKKSLDGALLTLSNTNPNDEANATKGLGLPRVKLKTLTPNSNELAESIGGKSSVSGVWDEEKHVGLMVYNVKELEFNRVTCKMEGAPVGLYVWGGTEWKSIGGDGDVAVHYYRDERDPNNIVEYPYRNFGDEAGDWMLESMRATTFDTNITTVTFDPSKNPAVVGSNSLTEPRWGYPNKSSVDPTNSSLFDLDQRMGLLYNWSAATANQNPSTANQGETKTPNPNLLEVGVQGICPNGWHVPSDKEWNALEKELSINGHKYTIGGILPGKWLVDWNYVMDNWRGDNHADIMKSPCPLPNSTEIATAFSLPSENGGFNLQLTGYFNGGHYFYGEYTLFTSCSSNNYELGYVRMIERKNKMVYRSAGYRVALTAVRCKKD